MYNCFGLNVNDISTDLQEIHVRGGTTIHIIIIITNKFYNFTNHKYIDRTKLNYTMEPPFSYRQK